MDDGKHPSSPRTFSLSPEGGEGRARGSARLLLFAVLAAFAPWARGQEIDAAAGAAAETGVAAVAPLDSGVHPLLAGSLNDPSNPVLPTLTLHAERLAALSPSAPLSAQAAREYLLPLAASHPADRLSAGILARLIARAAEAERFFALHPALLATPLARVPSLLGPPPRAPGIPSAPGAPAESGAEEKAAESGAAATALADVARLARFAERDPGANHLFDGGLSPPSLELDGLAIRRERLRDGKQKAERLGQGEFGRVDVHPRIPGAVVKTVEHDFETLLFTNQKPEQTAREEEATATRLAAIGAGPRYFGRRAVGGRQMSVRERVYGRTLTALIGGRGYGPEEHSLMLELLGRLADARVQPNDLRPSNVMIGRTLLDPRRRAYVVDGGDLEEMPSGPTREEARAALLGKQTILAVRMDPHVGLITRTKPFGRILEEGLQRAAETTFWRKLRGFGREFLSSMTLPPPR